MVAVYQLCRQVRSHCMLHHTQHTQIHKFTNTQMHKCACPILKMYFSKLKIIFGLQTDEVTGILHHRHPAPMVSPVYIFNVYLTYIWLEFFKTDCMYVPFFSQKNPSTTFPSIHTYTFIKGGFLSVHGIALPPELVFMFKF